MGQVPLIYTYRRRYISNRIRAFANTPNFLTSHVNLTYATTPRDGAGPSRPTSGRSPSPSSSNSDPTYQGYRAPLSLRAVIRVTTSSRVHEYRAQGYHTTTEYPEKGTHEVVLASPSQDNEIETTTNPVSLAHGGTKHKREFDNPGILDIPFTRPQFTWNNKQFQGNLIFESLDRAYCNAKWKQLSKTHS
ncbi:hypothetical protein Cgig2_004511 [Carnegiea gigantea]|uniref:Uncharacterized protein n=1 Tax=Carnegiea gigantea TaxID=171969 RepID=A0A9Q1K6T8_9CARY|nr:hypothetical protein Cgig2_004511 [Carnegiea gigantea]